MAEVLLVILASRQFVGAERIPGFLELAPNFTSSRTSYYGTLRSSTPLHSFRVRATCFARNRPLAVRAPAAVLSLPRPAARRGGSARLPTRNRSRYGPAHPGGRCGPGCPGRVGVFPRPPVCERPGPGWALVSL